MATIGFVGLGHMGSPMAANLIKNGHEVAVFDLNRQAMSTLVAMGAKPVESIAELARNKDFLISMLQTGQQVREVCLGPAGFFAHANKESVHIDCSSIDIESSRLIHESANEAGLFSLDAPVSGGVSGAQLATLTFMVGGADNAFERALPILKAMGQKIIHAGTHGTGQAAKLCNNMILGISMAAVSEAFSLAEKLGLDAEKLFDISSNASGQCWAMTQYCPVPGLVDNVPANHDYQPGFTAAMMLKDLMLSQQAASQVGLDAHLGKTATDLYKKFNEDGQGQLDFSAIIKLYKDIE